MQSYDINNKTIDQYVEKLKDVKDKTPAFYRNNMKYLSTSLYSQLTAFSKHLPNKKKIKVLSLACGEPNEFLALLTFYQERNCTIDYTGIDISEYCIKEYTNSFSAFSENFRLLTVDGSDPIKVKQKLQESKCLPEEGFDLVILRQPDIFFTHARHKIFRDMLEKVIPFVSTKDSRVFISCFHMEELNVITSVISPLNLYFKPGPGNYSTIEEGKGYVIYEGQKLYPDQHSIVMRCFGYAFNQEKLNKAKISLPVVSQEHNKHEVVINYSAQSEDYVRRLRFALGDNIVRGTPESGKVSFPRSWLTQLHQYQQIDPKATALDELSRELKVDKTVFKI